VRNPNFNTTEFSSIRNESGGNGFVITTKQWVESTNAIGLISKAGRYGGTYAHRDIAFEFATWISAEFKFYLITEFERLKEEEQKLIGWTAKRELSKINYRIHTDAIKANLIPAEVTREQAAMIYAVFFNDSLPQSERLIKLNQIAIQQMRVLEDVGGRKLLK